MRQLEQAQAAPATLRIHPPARRADNQRINAPANNRFGSVPNPNANITAAPCAASPVTSAVARML